MAQAAMAWGSAGPRGRGPGGAGDRVAKGEAGRDGRGGAGRMPWWRAAVWGDRLQGRVGRPVWLRGFERFAGAP